MEELYFEIFESLPRQGPGDDESTRKAFQMLPGLPARPDILDVGCGTGAQTLALAKLTAGQITAVDNHPPFLATLERNAHQAACADRIRCVVRDMNSLDCTNESFDLIWSEGAAYSMGFENALKSWRRLLRPNGCLVVSELVWFKKAAPQEITNYFAREYPDIQYYQNIRPLLESAGYEMIEYFPLPPGSWWTHFYTPAEAKIAQMRHVHRNNKDAQTLLDSFRLEIDMHRKYSEFYGYGFYLMRRTTCSAASLT